MDDRGSKKRWTLLDFGHGQGSKNLAQLPGFGFVPGKTSDSGFLVNPFDYSHGVQQLRGNPDEIGNKTWNQVNGDCGGRISLDSPHEQGSPSPELQAYIQDLDAQVRWLRGDLMDMKKTISHLATLVQISNSKVCSSIGKTKGRFDKLMSKYDTVYSCLRIVEAKVDCVRTRSGNSPSVILNLDDGNAGTAIGSKDKISRNHHEN